MKPTETSSEPSVGGGVLPARVEAEGDSPSLSRVQAERLAKSADLARAANTVFEAALAAKDELIAELARLLAESGGEPRRSIERIDPQVVADRAVERAGESARFHLSAVAADQERSGREPADDSCTPLEAELERSSRHEGKLRVQVATLEASAERLRAGWDEARSDVVEASRATAAREAAIRELRASLSISEASRDELLKRLERR